MCLRECVHMWFPPCSLVSPAVFFKFFLVRFPLYYELKIAFVVWLLSPYTKGASLIYRKFLHPLLSSKERVRYINYFYESFVRNVHHGMVYAIKQVKLSFHGRGKVLVFGFLTLLSHQLSICESICFSPGDRWLYCTSQGAGLWDSGQLRAPRVGFRSHCCCHCSREGNCSLTCFIQCHIKANGQSRVALYSRSL